MAPPSIDGAAYNCATYKSAAYDGAAYNGGSYDGPAYNVTTNYSATYYCASNDGKQPLMSPPKIALLIHPLKQLNPTLGPYQMLHHEA